MFDGEVKLCSRWMLSTLMGIVFQQQNSSINYNSIELCKGMKLCLGKLSFTVSNSVIYTLSIHYVLIKFFVSIGVKGFSTFKNLFDWSTSSSNCNLVPW